MESKSPPKERLDLIPIFKMYWDWKYILLGVFLISGFTIWFVVKSIPPLYESHTTLYPSNTNSRDQQLQNFGYGFEIHSERLVQMLQSESILDSLVEKFDLMVHYSVDPLQIDSWDKYYEVARERIQFHKTRYSSVVISVMDEEPKLAADIANETARLVNVVNANILKNNAKSALDLAKKEFQERISGISMINDSIHFLRKENVNSTENILLSSIQKKRDRIKELRLEVNRLRKKHQIFDYKAQTKILNEEFAQSKSLYLNESGKLEILEGSNFSGDSSVTFSRARMKGAKKSMDYFESRLIDLAEVDARFSLVSEQMADEKDLLNQLLKSLEELQKSLEPDIRTRSLASLQSDYDWDQIQMRELKRNYQKALANYLDPVPIAFLVGRAKPSYQKVYPKTLLSLFIGTLGVMAFAMAIISIVERFRKGKA